MLWPNMICCHDNHNYIQKCRCASRLTRMVFNMGRLFVDIYNAASSKNSVMRRLTSSTSAGAS